MPTQRRVIIVHGWDNYPEDGWFPWLKKELEARGFEVIVPRLPDTKTPRIQNWMPALADAIGEIDEQTYLVGHSMGCQTIARYLESLPEGKRAGGAVFVAGFFKRLTGLEDEEEVRETSKHWLETLVDLNKARKHLKDSIAIFSDNDPYVPLDNQDDFKNLLGSKIIIEHEKGHFSGALNDCFELPIVLDSLLAA
ncbi:MAG: serine hydrolase family protein [Candidatus Portnoybacteria bacterium]|nr:serine hydrolase family protein [Candidatus Portnoybacteria bacterium]